MLGAIITRLKLIITPPLLPAALILLLAACGDGSQAADTPTPEAKVMAKLEVEPTPIKASPKPEPTKPSTSTETVPSATPTPLPTATPALIPEAKVVAKVEVGPTPIKASPKPEPTKPAASTRALPAYWPTEGWRTSTPEEQGMDSEKLGDMLASIKTRGYDIDSVTVVRNGYIVLDATFFPFMPNSKHQLYSVTKSIVSALVGIAIDQGHLDGAREPVLDLFPERTAANLTEDKEAITLENVLTMTTGLKCEDSWKYEWRGLWEMMQNPDWVQFMLDLPMKEEPGTRFEYCNGASFLLSAIIQEATGMNAHEYAEKHLFAPLGISDTVWPSNHQGITLGWAELLLRPRDMAKIGYLFLNEGLWDGEQIVSSAWVAASTRKHIFADGDGYGYQWWVYDGGFYYALGLAGQFIVVAPEEDIVVVFTSDMIADPLGPRKLVNEFIVSAAKTRTPLPANPDGVARLRILTDDAARPEATPETVPPPLAIAEHVLGQTYKLEKNELGWESITLVRQGDEVLLRLAIDGLSFEAAIRLGLDGVQRLVFSPDHNMPVAGKGYWEGQNVFIAEIDDVGNLDSWRLELKFKDDAVTATLTSTGTSPGTWVIQGKRQEFQ